ncbi:hypothetical protein K435DRAFT_851054 [Dendrothele bispora CBS 962.96]|uniref:Uncharacterized protein n=1 Tax=Dendrothele bispora (strain CBS 962.96) TaxID=1314807 RepID=A0A4S8MMV7_DENBC|nr:hypothetical protein K435DRAFT_851054 [Dendrothele bispora CBS 962.96]
MSVNRNPTVEDERTRNRNPPLYIESPCPVSDTKHEAEQSRAEFLPDHILHPNHSQPKDGESDEGQLKNAHDNENNSSKINVDEWVRSVSANGYSSEHNTTKKATIEPVFQNHAPAYPVEVTRVQYDKLLNRYRKVKSNCNDLHVSLDHAKVASEAGWTKFWRADAECRELRKVVNKSQKELDEARKAIEESAKELEEVREELDGALSVREQAVFDARFWQRKWAEMGGAFDVADLYDDFP